MAKVYDMKKRTQSFAIEIIKYCETLFETKSETNRIIGRQLIRCGTSVGANYRASQRGKSKADFINKLKIVEEEADETIYWLEILEAFANEKEIEQLTELKAEGNEILAIVVSSIIKTRENLKK